MAHPDRNDQKTPTSMSRHLNISAQSAVRHRIGEVPAFFATQNALRNILTKRLSMNKYSSFSFPETFLSIKRTMNIFGS